MYNYDVKLTGNTEGKFKYTYKDIANFWTIITIFLVFRLVDQNCGAVADEQEEWDGWVEGGEDAIYQFIRTLPRHFFPESLK